MFWDESWNIDFINVFGLRIISLIFRENSHLNIILYILLNMFDTICQEINVKHGN